MLSIRSQLLLNSNSTFSILGEKLSKMSNFFSVNQKSDPTLKLNPTHQHESKDMLGFQNRSPDIKLLLFHIKRDNSVYLEKHDFQRKLVCQL